MYYPLILGIEVVLAVVIIFLILVYRGKGADVGAVFSGSSSVFGAKGSVPFATKLIAILSALFIINSLLLAYLANRTATDAGVFESVPIKERELDLPVEDMSPVEKESDFNDIPQTDPTQN